MSNYPGAPQNPAYPPSGMPPQGYPPQGYGPPPSQTSASAVASFVCGLLGCFPFLTSIAAILLGMIGMGATSKPNVKGRVFAILGLLLGLLGLVSWSVGSYIGYNVGMSVYLLGVDAEKMKDTGDFTSLQDVSDVPLSKLEELTKKVKAHGGISATTTDKDGDDANSGKMDGTTTGTMTMKDGLAVPFSMKWGLVSWRVRITDITLDFDKAKPASDTTGRKQ